MSRGLGDVYKRQSNSMEGGNKISSKSKPAADACWIAKRPPSGVHIGGIQERMEAPKVGFIIVLFLFVRVTK